jgi:hypothetical protein
MNKIIRNKDNGYSVINNHCLRNKNISEKAKGVFAIIMSLPDNWDFSINGLISICHGGETAIRSAIKELIEHGYCERNVSKDLDTKKILGWEYTFSEKPLCDFPQVDLPQVGFPNMGNQGQLSKEKLIPNKTNKEKELVFDFLWSLYPNKNNKKIAKDKFLKLTDKEIESVSFHLPIFSTLKPFATYSHPHLSTYLNQKRFNDEIEKPIQPQSTSQYTKLDPNKIYD